MTIAAPRRLPSYHAGKLFFMELLSENILGELSSFSFLVLFGNCKPKSSVRASANFFSPFSLLRLVAVIKLHVFSSIRARTVQEGIRRIWVKSCVSKKFASRKHKQGKKFAWKAKTSWRRRRRKVFPFFPPNHLQRRLKPNNKVCLG